MTSARVIVIVMSGIMAAGLPAQAGTITIIERESLGRNDLFAGSGGAVQQHDVSNNTSALTGPFAFSDAGMVEITEMDPFSNGAAEATGLITVDDDVVQSSPGRLSLSANRVAGGTAMHNSGTGNATSIQRQTFRVRFQVNDHPAKFTLSGNFDPGIVTGLVGEAQRVKLRRPFTPTVLFDINTAGELDESGMLIAGNTYELEVRITDLNSANAGNPMITDLSTLNLLLDIVSLTPGDGNADGWVDGLDYLLWAGNFGTHPGADGNPSDGDYNDDGWVDGLDYLLWAGNFGTHAGVAAPEPSGLLLLTVGTTLLGRWRRRLTVS